VAPLIAYVVLLIQAGLGPSGQPRSARG